LVISPNFNCAGFGGLGIPVNTELRVTVDRQTGKKVPGGKNMGVHANPNKKESFTAIATQFSYFHFKEFAVFFDGT
jgi:hypothetical protein